MNKSTLFKRAWQIAKATGKSFRIALIKAWECYRLKKAMAQKSVRFAYEKANGKLRYALGTTSPKIMEIPTGSGKSSIKVLTYYDLEANGWRCFRVENLIKIY